MKKEINLAYNLVIKSFKKHLKYSYNGSFSCIIYKILALKLVLKKFINSYNRFFL